VLPIVKKIWAPLKILRPTWCPKLVTGLILCTPIQPEVPPLANTSVTPPAPNMEKDQLGSIKAQDSGSKQISSLKELPTIIF